MADKRIREIYRSMRHTAQVWRRIGFACLLSSSVTAFIAAGLISPAQADDPDASLSGVQSRIKALKESLFSRRGRAEKLDSALREAETAVAEIEKTLREKTHFYDERRAHLEALKRRQAILTAELQHHRTALIHQLRTAFTIGRKERLKLLLNQENPALVGRTLVYYDYFNRDRAQQIMVAQSSLVELESLGSEIAKTVTELERTLATLKQQKSELAATRTERHRVLASLQKEIATDEKQLSRLKADEQRLQLLVEKVIEEARQEPVAVPAPARPPQAERQPEVATAPPAATVRPVPSAAAGQAFRPDKPFWQQKGSLPWPTAGRVTGRFGRSRSAASGTTWQGVYIEAKSGQEVRAVSSGRVAFAEWIRGFGLMVILDHGGGYMSLYGHNQSIFRKVGEQVNAGDVISTVGDSGGQGSPGLYFEIRSKGQPQNPERWCDRGSPVVRLAG